MSLHSEIVLWDLDMLSKADQAIVVVGEDQTRSKTMEAALLDAIDNGGLRARQVLLPSNVLPRLDTTRLPLVDITDSEFIESSIDIFAALCSEYPAEFNTSSTRVFILTLSSIIYAWSDDHASCNAPTVITLFCSEHHVRQLFSSISITPLAIKFAWIVLFLRENTIRPRPSNSSNLTGGGGSSGAMRTTDDSTNGAGRKLFFPTCMSRSTLE
ncbi:hypothetical protein JVU11DRAFT_8963 [Chiua virens]|nr:hypothetical protein JVU11DRAFT_8963 [Chiua virens]